MLWKLIFIKLWTKKYSFYEKVVKSLQYVCSMKFIHLRAIFITISSYKYLMNSRFLCGVNLPAQVHLVANSPSHFSAWGLMSFYVEGECISSVRFSSCQQTCSWEEAAGVYMGHNQQVEPCCCLETFSVSATLTRFSAAEEWGFMNGCLKNQEQWGLWVLCTAGPTGCLPHIHFPSVSSSLAEIWFCSGFTLWGR